MFNFINTFFVKIYLFLQIQDDQISISEDSSVCGKHNDRKDDIGSPLVGLYPERANHSSVASNLEV